MSAEHLTKCTCGRDYDPAESKRKGLPPSACSLACVTDAIVEGPDDDGDDDPTSTTPHLKAVP